MKIYPRLITEKPQTGYDKYKLMKGGNYP